MKMQEKYKVPEKIASMTVNFMYGLSEQGSFATVKEYLQKHGFALTADLLSEGFKPADIEEAVNNGAVKVAYWPEKDTKTHLYWLEEGDALQKLEELAEQAAKFCYGRTPDEAVGGNFRTVGAEMESQQRALVGLIYAREQGKLREVDIDITGDGCGPLYVAKGTFADEMFRAMIPDRC